MFSWCLQKRSRDCSLLQYNAAQFVLPVAELTVKPPRPHSPLLEQQIMPTDLAQFLYIISLFISAVDIP